MEQTEFFLSQFDLTWQKSEEWYYMYCLPGNAALLPGRDQAVRRLYSLLCTSAVGLLLLHGHPGCYKIAWLDCSHHVGAELWDSCLALIFGDAGKIFRQAGMTEWNKTLFEKQPHLLKKLDTLSSLNLDSLFDSHLKGIIELTGLKPKGKWILYLGPDQNLSLEIGGCSSNGMAIDLANPKITKDILTEAMPHEFEHMIFEQAKSKDPEWGTDLAATLDEGLACYFTYEYFKKNLPKYRIIEQMTKEQFQWYLNHEKEIFEQSIPYLMSNVSGQNPYKCNCRAGGCKKLFDQAPKTICYFLGFRIIEFYTKRHGKNSWINAYKVPMKELVKQSGYSEYIKALKH